MTKISHARSKSKLTVNGYAHLAKQLSSLPALAKAFEDGKAEELNRLLVSAKWITVEEVAGTKLKQVVNQLTNLAAIEQLAITRPAATQLKEHTASRLLEEYPPLGAHFMDLMGNALGYEELLRQLVLHYNFENLEAGDVNDLLYQVEEVRTIMRQLHNIHAESSGNRKPAA